MKRYIKILIWIAVTIVGLVIIFHWEPEYNTRKVYSADRQYSVFTRYKNKKIYEHFVVVFPGTSSNYHDCETILFDEEADSIVARLHIWEEGFLSDESNVFFTVDSVGVDGRVRAKLPRVINMDGMNNR